MAPLTLYERGIAPGPSLGLVNGCDVLRIGRCRCMGGGAPVARKPWVAVSVEQGSVGPPPERAGARGTHLSTMFATYKVVWQHFLTYVHRYTPVTVGHGGIYSKAKYSKSHKLSVGMQVQILEDVSRGELLFTAASTSLKIMSEFAAAQAALLGRGLPLEKLCALLNNNVDCYNQSLEFTEHVQVGLGAERGDGYPFPCQY